MGTTASKFLGDMNFEVMSEARGNLPSFVLSPNTLKLAAAEKIKDGATIKGLTVDKFIESINTNVNAIRTLQNASYEHALVPALTLTMQEVSRSRDDHILASNTRERGVGSSYIEDFNKLVATIIIVKDKFNATNINMLIDNGPFDKNLKEHLHASINNPTPMAVKMAMEFDKDQNWQEKCQAKYPKQYTEIVSSQKIENTVFKMGR